MPELQGVLTAMVTPFDAAGELDLAASRRLARYLVEQGSHGLVVAGTTGESSTLSDDEIAALLEATLDEVGDRATVICGTGSNDTRHAVKLTERASERGAHAALSVTPYYNKPNRRGLEAHFAAVSEAAGETPVILYNIPSRSVVNMAPDLLAELAARHANIVAVKQANSDELGPIAGLEILAGNDDDFARTLAFGGAGAILVAANVAPDRMREIYDAGAAGDDAHARELELALTPFYEALAVAPLAVSAKTSLELLGLIEAHVRLPLVAADESERETLAAELRRQGLLAEGEAAAA